MQQKHIEISRAIADSPTATTPTYTDEPGHACLVLQSTMEPPMEAESTDRLSLTKATIGPTHTLDVPRRIPHPPRGDARCNCSQVRRSAVAALARRRELEAGRHDLATSTACHGEGRPHRQDRVTHGRRVEATTGAQRSAASRHRSGARATSTCGGGGGTTWRPRLAAFPHVKCKEPVQGGRSPTGGSHCRGRVGAAEREPL